jgi:hypothetical protein
MQLTIMETLDTYMNHITLINNSITWESKRQNIQTRDLSIHVCMDIITGKTLKHAGARLQGHEHGDGKQMHDLRFCLFYSSSCMSQCVSHSMLNFLPDGA